MDLAPHQVGTTNDGPGVSDSPDIPPAPPTVTLNGYRVDLRPVRAQDYEQLRVIELREDLVPLWRYQGATPSPERWVEGFWNGVLAQFIVIGKASGEALGLVSLYNVDFRHGYGYLAATKFDPGARSPSFLEGVALFLDYVFKSWNLRKLYIETSEMSLAQFRSGLELLFEQEGRLVGHRYFDGKYWDQYLLAIYRNRWDELSGEISWMISPREQASS